MNRLPLSRPIHASRTPNPAYYDPTIAGDGRRVPSARWSERGVTGDDEAGASRLPLSRRQKLRTRRHLPSAGRIHLVPLALTERLREGAPIASQGLAKAIIGEVARLQPALQRPLVSSPGGPPQRVWN